MDNKNYNKEYLNEEIEDSKEKKIILLAAAIGGILVLVTLFYSIRF